MTGCCIIVSTQDLVKAAIGFVKRDEGCDEEVLLASAQQVASATARLRAASNAKSDPLSPSHRCLIEASNAILAATRALVETARIINENNPDAMIVEPSKVAFHCSISTSTSISISLI